MVEANLVSHGFPMRVFKWPPTFTADNESSIVSIWVSFPALPAHLFQKETFFAIASNIGTPLQIADSTYNQSNLSKARVCVEIDLLKPLLGEIDLKICECYSKGNAPKPPRRRVDGKTTATIEQKKQQTKKEKWVAARNEPTVGVEKGECSNASVEILHEGAENVELSALSVENEAYIENEENVAIIENEDNNVEDVVCALKNDVVEDVVVGNEIVGALILRPSNTDCHPIRGMKLINDESSWRLFQSLKKLGVVAYELKDDEDENIEMNRIALNTALLFQKHFLPPICLDT
ncbi:UNVERIFIED_CONTAM: hypothetical protein Slati_2719300 [Sesamum latifolium]|uniref:DUF4283 domain-containing protein n=1 Tax=Sesamum latifolium TaxID=2727402 RepID=A0AAW2VY94_9LAMI